MRMKTTNQIPANKRKIRKTEWKWKLNTTAFDIAGLILALQAFLLMASGIGLTIRYWYEVNAIWILFPIPFIILSCIIGLITSIKRKVYIEDEDEDERRTKTRNP